MEVSLTIFKDFYGKVYAQISKKHSGIQASYMPNVEVRWGVLTTQLTARISEVTEEDELDFSKI